MDTTAIDSHLFFFGRFGHLDLGVLRATGTKRTTPSITPSLFRPSECRGLTDRPPKPSEEATDNILGPLPSPDIDKLLIAEPLPWAKKDETVEEKDRFPFTREEEVGTPDYIGSFWNACF